MIQYWTQSVVNKLQFQFGLKIVSVALALMLWVVVMGSKTIEITKEVPVEVELGGDLILSEPPPERVVYRLVGPKAFLRAAGAKLDEPLRINLGNKKPG